MRTAPGGLLIVGVGAVVFASGASMAAGSPCNTVALVSARTGAVVRSFDIGSVSGSKAVSDGHDGWFVAGPGLVRLRNNGRVDRTWHPALPPTTGAVRALARSGGTLYVTDRFRVIALDAVTGRRLWVSRSVDAGQEGYRNGIMALAASPSAVSSGATSRASERQGVWRSPRSMPTTDISSRGRRRPCTATHGRT